MGLARLLAKVFSISANSALGKSAPQCLSYLPTVAAGVPKDSCVSKNDESCDRRAKLLDSLPTHNRIATTTLGDHVCTKDRISEGNSDLFLDGEALADLITEKILSNEIRVAEDKKGSRAHVREIRNLAYNLFIGSPFPLQVKGDVIKKIEFWVSKRPADSISLPDFFSACVAHANGNIQEALMIAWNVLSNNYKKVEERNIYPHTLKFHDITGERELHDGQDHVRKEVRWNGQVVDKKIKVMRGDNFSAWYHFFGTALSAYYMTVKEPVTGRGKLKTDVMIWAEENALFNDHVDPLKRIKIDQAGALFGRRLAENLRNYKTLGDFQKSVHIKRSPYLRCEPQVYGRRWRLKPGQHPRDYGAATWSNAPSFFGLLERYRSVTMLEDAKNLDPNVLIPFIEDPNPVIRRKAQNKYVMCFDTNKQLITEVERKLNGDQVSLTSDQRSAWLGVLASALSDLDHEDLLDHQATKWIETLAQDASDANKLHAIEFLEKRVIQGRSVDEFTASLLDQLSKDKDISVRIRTGRAINYLRYVCRYPHWDLDKDETTQILSRFLLDPSSQVRSTMAEIMVRTEAYPLLEKPLERGDIGVAIAIKPYLDSHKSESKFDRLRSLMPPGIDKKRFKHRISDYLDPDLGKIRLLQDLLGPLGIEEENMP